MITTERERLKRAIEQDCLLPTHSNAGYVQSLKQALTEVRLRFISAVGDIPAADSRINLINCKEVAVCEY